MSLARNLSDEEAYLYAILSDESGLDLGEFYLVDGTSEDNCYRAWDFQWVLWRGQEKFQADMCGRGVGKSEGVKLRAFAFPFNFPGEEMMITAPELNHLRLLTDKIEYILLYTRLGREMRPSTKGHGINHQPQFQCTFINGAKIISRLPNIDGRGVKGAHPLRIEQDESQNYPKGGWTEIIETMKAGHPKAQWRAHGVPLGTRDMFYTITMNEDPNLPFKVHKYIASHRPDWSDDERRRKIALYGGSEENIDYRRNIFGDHGDAYNPIFVLARLMACVRIQESTWATRYNDVVYHKVRITDEELRKRDGVIENFLLDIPGTHLAEEYTSFWAGMDIGFTDDPSEILLFGSLAQKGGPDLQRLLLRVQMRRVKAGDQIRVMRTLFETYGDRLRRFGLDKTGVGLPLLQVMQERIDDGEVGYKAIMDRLVGYGFSQKVPVAFDDREPEDGEQPEDLVILKNVKDHSTDRLRRYVDDGLFELPYDKTLLDEWQGAGVVAKRTASDGVQRTYTGGNHTLDAARMMVMAKDLMAIEEALKPRQEEVLDAFI